MGKKTAGLLTTSPIVLLFQRSYYSHIYWAFVVCPKLCPGYKNELALIPTLKEFNRSVRTKRIHFRKQIFIKKRSAFGDFPSSEQKSQLTKKWNIPIVHF